jgi:hypothetical protein
MPSNYQRKPESDIIEGQSILQMAQQFRKPKPMKRVLFSLLEFDSAT